MLKTGQIVITKGIQYKTVDNMEFARFIADSISRHISGDWGDVCLGDKETNDEAYDTGGRIMSVYTGTQDTIWIITEADRSSTTVLFPTEY